MSVRIQVILDEEEAARLKSQAQKESKSLSAWFREAGRKMLEHAEQQSLLSKKASLKDFFQRCIKRERGVEPDWEEHKRILMEGYRIRHRS